MLISEFVDNEHFSGLESLVIQLNNSAADSRFKVLVHLPDEVLREKLTDLFQLCEVDFSFSQDRKQFNPSGIQLRLTPLLKENFAYLLSESEMDLGLGALSAAIEAMPSLHTSGTEKKFSLKKYTLGQYLRLDVAALKSLNVFPQ